jgi:hypothetical protein
MPKTPGRLLALWLTAGALTLPLGVRAGSIQYCEDISDKLGHYSSREELFDDLTVKAQRKALTQLLAAELENFEPGLVSREIFIDSLLHLVEHDSPQYVSGGLLTACAVLPQARIDDIHRSRFIAVDAGKVCSFNTDLLQNQSTEIKEKFVERFFGKAQLKDDKASEITELVTEPEKIKKKFGKDLLKLVRETPASPPHDALEQTQCVRLQIYPIELYTLSVPYLDMLAEMKSGTLSTDDLKTLADRQARWHGLDPRLFRALIEQESRWEARAVSHKGAVGLAQLMPATAREECGLSPKELTDPHANLGCAAHYLAKYINRFNDVELALCAYNAGPGAVASGKCRRYRETRRYVSTIIASTDSNNNNN